MKYLQAFKYELQPNGEQARSMRRFAGLCRFVFNKALAMQKTIYGNGETKIGYAGLCKTLTEWSGGYPVGVLANDVRFKSGSFSWDVAEKFQRFIDMCDTFHLPVVNLIDQPGFFIGVRSEEMGTIRKGVRASFAVLQATVPWASVYVRK